MFKHVRHFLIKQKKKKKKKKNFDSELKRFFFWASNTGPQVFLS
jgi:hypothetical protein